MPSFLELEYRTVLQNFATWLPFSKVQIIFKFSFTFVCLRYARHVSPNVFMAVTVNEDTQTEAEISSPYMLSEVLHIFTDE